VAFSLSRALSLHTAQSSVWTGRQEYPDIFATLEDCPSSCDRFCYSSSMFSSSVKKLHWGLRFSQQWIFILGSSELWHCAV